VVADWNYIAEESQAQHVDYNDMYWLEKTNDNSCKVEWKTLQEFFSLP
jgi:hypothetical protein